MRKERWIFAFWAVLVLGTVSLSAKSNPLGTGLEEITGQTDPRDGFAPLERIQQRPGRIAPVRSLQKHDPFGPDAIIYNNRFGSPYTDVFQMIVGRVPGVQVIGGPFQYQIRIRAAQRPPLVVVDGMPFNNLDDRSMNNLLMSIPTADVEAIEVIKNGASGMIYGWGASNGVLLIKMRRGGQD